jgi:hypothetical protein
MHRWEDNIKVNTEEVRCEVLTKFDLSGELLLT